MLKRKPRFPRSCFIRIMDDEIRFLRDAADELRRLANLSPEIAEQLQRLAGELEAEATRLESRGRTAGA